jgi:hypothetical protein
MGHTQSIFLSFFGMFLNFYMHRQYSYFINHGLSAALFALSRITWVLSGLHYKRGLLLRAAHSRHRAFKLSPFRSIKLFDFEHENGEDQLGTLKRPVVSSDSVIFKKAQYFVNLRKIVADEISRLDLELSENENTIIGDGTE